MNLEKIEVRNTLIAGVSVVGKMMRELMGLEAFVGSLYVLIALGVVYFYFYNLAPTVIGSVKEWTVFTTLRTTVSLALIAILLGSVGGLYGGLALRPRSRIVKPL